MSIQNPWRSIWFHPRETIRAVVEENPRKSLWLLALIYGFPSIVSNFQSLPSASQVRLPVFLAIALILAPLIGYLSFCIWSWVVLFVGRPLKGQATFSEARAAYAWSRVPLICNGLIWIGLILIYGKLVFATAQEQQAQLSVGHLSLLLLGILARSAFAIWSFILYLQALAEVQRFSILRSIGNVLIATIVMGLAIVLIGIVIGFFAPSFFQSPQGSAGSLQSMIDLIT